MVIDELARLDDLSTEKLVVSIQQSLSEGLLDQFIGIDTGRAGLYRAHASNIAKESAFQVTEITK